MKKWVAAFIVLALVGITPPVHSDSDLKGPSPEQALRQLLEGNERFVTHHMLHPDSTPSDAPQHPVAVVLSCADSRVPPELVFDQGVGTVFVVRGAGNTFDRLALQSIEYGVEHLGARLILVIGHDQCGAVTAAVKAYPDPKAGPMLENIYPAVRATEHVPPADRISATIDANAKIMARRLSEEPALKHLVAAGELRILPVRYNLTTGRVQRLSDSEP